LRQCGVTRLGRENTRISIEYQFQAHDGQEITRMIIFDLKPEGFFSTMEDFDKKARGGWGPNRRLPIPQDIIEKTKPKQFWPTVHIIHEPLNIMIMIP
jgi:hypothetical protein